MLERFFEPRHRGTMVRTGALAGTTTFLTGVVTSLLFFLATFFTPLTGAIPGYATAPALIIVGIFMMRAIGQINFCRLAEGAPAFLTLLLMPLTYSISTGLAFGFISYVLIKLFLRRIRACDPLLPGVALPSLASLIV
jgi:AGZA family xanthine/uracil permease-like MFS transporter